MKHRSTRREVSGAVERTLDSSASSAVKRRDPIRTPQSAAPRALFQPSYLEKGRRNSMQTSLHSYKVTVEPGKPIREAGRTVEARPLRYRSRRVSRPRIRFRHEISSRQHVRRGRAAVPDTRRAPLPVAGRGTHVRQHVRARRAIHRREDARCQPAAIGSATRRRSRRSSASPTRSSSTRRCFAGWR